MTHLLMGIFFLPFSPPDWCTFAKLLLPWNTQLRGREPKHSPSKGTLRNSTPGLCWICSISECCLQLHWPWCQKVLGNISYFSMKISTWIIKIRLPTVFLHLCRQNYMCEPLFNWVSVLICQTNNLYSSPLLLKTSRKPAGPADPLYT